MIVTLQAWFDDSGTKGTGRFMSMAGLFGSADVFAQVADEWDLALRARHPGLIHYFKMDEACVLDGEFNFWQEPNRDQKVQQMARVIDRDDLHEIAVAVDLAAYAKVFPHWAKAKDHFSGVRHSLNQPYIMLFQYVLTAAITEAVKRGSTRPMEFIVDHHDVFKRPILDSHDDMLRDEAAFPERRAVIPEMPWFRNDKDWVILQAADLLAGEMRIIAEQKTTGLAPPAFFNCLCPRLKSSGHFKLIAEEEMREMEHHVRQTLTEDDDQQSG